MKSYTTGRALYGVWTKNTATANLTFGDQMANDFYRKLCASKDWPFLERLRTLTTTASTQFYNLPYDTSMVRSIYVTIGTTRYTPKLSPSRDHWDRLNLSTFTSDIPEWYFVYNGQVGLWPTPASSSNVITLNTKIRVIDLSVADLTSQTVTITTATTTVTGSGTTWRRGLTGFWLQVPLNSSSDTTSGDSEWYEINSVASTTSLSLVRAYNGPTVTSNTGTIIGQMPVLPEEFHDTPWKYAAYKYWLKEKDKMRSEDFKASYIEDVGLLNSIWSAPTTDMVVDDGRDFNIINPNLTISI